MKIRIITILITTMLGMGAAYHVLHSPHPRTGSVSSATPTNVKEEITQDIVEVDTPDIRSIVPVKQSIPKEAKKDIILSPPPHVAASPSTPPPAEKNRTAEQKNQQAIQYWNHRAQTFDRFMKQLDAEQNPARRSQLINAMARHVRFNTLDTLDWAMGLEDPEEKRAALEAINKDALSGIGARIEIDQSGLPKIRDTTILSAIESTGQVEPGDYISGMINGDGSTTYFKGLSIQKIVQMLRGKPGSEIQLLMERVPEQGGGALVFNVPVRRSMIVVEPPF